MAAEDSAWRGRVNDAAEELRSNLSSNPFGQHASGGAASHGGGSAAAPPPPRMPNQRPPVLGARTSAGEGLASAAVAAAERHEAAWARLEASVESGTGPIHYVDIPWPPDGASITGRLPGATAAEAKKSLVAALRRWHPDKWRRILDRVPQAEQAQVTERVKCVAQRLLEEKKGFTARNR